MALRGRSLLTFVLERGETLAQQTGGGIFWFFLTYILDRGLQIARLILVAAIIDPAQQGLVGIAIFSVSALDIATQSGVQQAVVQKRQVTDEDLDAAWMVSLLRGVVLSVIIIAAAPWLAAFFGAPDSEAILRLIGFTPLINGLNNIGVALFERHFQFRRRLVFQVGGTAADLMLSVGLALMLRDAWGLALGITGGHLARLALSFMLQPYRPRLTFDWARIRELLGFGRWITSSWFLIFIAYQGAEAAVGRMLGAASLALYQISNRLGDFPGELTNVIGVVAFPAYSRLQDDARRLTSAYLRAIRLATFVTLPVAATVVTLADPFTHLLFRPAWYEVSGLIAVLAVAGGVRSIISLGSPAFLGANLPKFEVWMQLARVVSLATVLVPCILWWGTEGAAWAVVIGNTAGLPIWLAGSRRLTGLSGWVLVRPLLINGGLALVSALTMYGLTRGTGLPLLVQLVLAPVMGGAVYLLGTALLVRSGHYELGDDLLEILENVFPVAALPAAQPLPEREMVSTK
jgi:O-antigen/teichoic acid export membrane protein